MTVSISVTPLSFKIDLHPHPPVNLHLHVVLEAFHRAFSENFLLSEFELTKCQVIKTWIILHVY